MGQKILLYLISLNYIEHSYSRKQKQTVVVQKKEVIKRKGVISSGAGERFGCLVERLKVLVLTLMRIFMGKKVEGGKIYKNLQLPFKYYT